MNEQERERDMMLAEIEEKFNDFLAQEMKDYESKVEMKIAIHKYFLNEVQKYTTKELREKLKDSEAIVKDFSEFLKNAECIAC